jgi:hypothetical protein
VSTIKEANLGPLPIRFAKSTMVTVVIYGRRAVKKVLPGRMVQLSPAGLACGVYPIVVDDIPNTHAVQPVLRIWVITGPKGLQRIGFPSPLAPLGLS